MNVLDTIDEQLITLLEQDAKQSSAVLAEKVHLSSAAVRRRVNRLFQSNSLHLVACRDPIRARLPVSAMIACSIERGVLDAVVQELCARSEVIWACLTTGRFDLFIFAFFHSNEELSDFLRFQLTDIKGIRNTETFICLHINKNNGFLSS
jgi:Lrp/AsnC family transcriptional regulator, regulator for asnA, asnC and gidA